MALQAAGETSRAQADGWCDSDDGVDEEDDDDGEQHKGTEKDAAGDVDRLACSAKSIVEDNRDAIEDIVVDFGVGATTVLLLWLSQWSIAAVDVVAFVLVDDSGGGVVDMIIVTL